MSLNPPGFVGRSRELRLLLGLRATARRNGAAVAVIVAEPGIGKTRLLAEAADQLRLPILHVQGSATGREVALAASAGLLRELTQAPRLGVELEALLTGESITSRGFEPVRLFELAFRCLAALGPRTILADDLQWADRQSLALLQYVVTAARAEGAPLILLTAARPSLDVEPFVAALAAGVTSDALVDLRLDPLDEADGRELVADIAPGLPSDEAHRLWSQARGSPFWIGLLAGGRGGARDLARLIEGRWAGLDDDARQLFAMLLVAGEPLTLVDLGELLGWPEARTRVATRTLVNRGVALLNGAVRIAHDLIRESAIAGLPDRERTALDAQFADWLEQSGDDDVLTLSRALEHRRAAGAPGIEVAQRVALSPQRRLLGNEGLSLLEAIADGATAAAERELQRAVATLAIELGRWESALPRWSRLVHILPAGPQRADAALAAATAAFRLARALEVHEFVRLARADAAGELRIEIEADSLEFQATNWLEGRPVDAQPLLDRAITTGEALVEAAGGVEGLDDPSCDAYVRAVRARLDAAIRRADAEVVAGCAEVIERAARDPSERMAAASDAIFSTLQFEGLPRLAEARARRALTEARRLHLPNAEVEALHWAGWIAQHRGHLDVARDRMLRAIALAERVGPPRRFTLDQLRAIGLSVEASLGDWHTAVDGIERALTDERNPHFRLVIRSLQLWLLGRFATTGSTRIDTVIASAMPDIEAAGCDRCHWEVVLHGAEAAARLGEVGLGAELVHGWDAANPRPRPGATARRAYVGALLSASVDPNRALPLFDAADQRAEAVGHDLMRLWIALDRAISMSRTDRDRGIEALSAVGRAAGAMGATSERQIALRELRALGVRTWQRGRRHEGELSGREREIAELIAGGASNPEIAAALFLSRKTVERHLSNIFEALGVRNRVELAARVGRNNEGVPR